MSPSPFHISQTAPQYISHQTLESGVLYIYICTSETRFAKKKRVHCVIPSNEHIGTLTSDLSRQEGTLIILDVIVVSYIDEIQVYGSITLILNYPCAR